MKKFSTVITIFMASLATLLAKTPTHALVTATKTSEFPHSFSLTNIGSDTLAIEFVVVDCAGVEQTPVHLYLNSTTSDSQPVRHKTGSLASVIRHSELVAPGESRYLNFVFGVRVPQDAVTISIMVRNQRGERYYVCCTGNS